MKQVHRAFLVLLAVIKPHIFTAGVGVSNWESFGVGAERELGEISNVLEPCQRLTFSVDNGTRHSLAGFIQGCDCLWDLKSYLQVLLHVLLIMLTDCRLEGCQLWQ